MVNKKTTDKATTVDKVNKKTTDKATPVDKVNKKMTDKVSMVNKKTTDIISVSPCNNCHSTPALMYDISQYVSEDNMAYFNTGERLHLARCCACNRKFTRDQEGNAFITLKSGGKHPMSVFVCRNQPKFNCLECLCNFCYLDNQDKATPTKRPRRANKNRDL
jgi:hypothetical protein